MIEHNYLTTYDQNQSIHQNLMKLSIYFGNFSAAKYLWKKQTDEDKRTNVAQWLTKVLEFVNIKLSNDDPGSEEFADIITDLIANLSDKNQQNDFFFSRRIPSNFIVNVPVLALEKNILP